MIRNRSGVITPLICEGLQFDAGASFFGCRRTPKVDRRRALSASSRPAIRSGRRLRSVRPAIWRARSPRDRGAGSRNPRQLQGTRRVTISRPTTTSGSSSSGSTNAGCRFSASAPCRSTSRQRGCVALQSALSRSSPGYCGRRPTVSRLVPLVSARSVALAGITHLLSASAPHFLTCALRSSPRRQFHVHAARTPQFARTEHCPVPIRSLCAGPGDKDYKAGDLPVSRALCYPTESTKSASVAAGAVVSEMSAPQTSAAITIGHRQMRAAWRDIGFGNACRRQTVGRAWEGPPRATAASTAPP